MAYYGLLWLIMVITILPVFGTRKDYIRMPIRNPRGLDFPIVCLVNVRSQLDIDILLDMLEEERKQKIITAEQKGHACNMHFVYYTGNISTNDQRAINDKSMMSDGRSSKLPTRSPALAGNQGVNKRTLWKAIHLKSTSLTLLSENSVG